MVNRMFAVLVAGSIGYVLSGWAGVAVGACAATIVAVLTETLTPVDDQWTAHERRMRRNRRYRARYEALEEGWRRPGRPARRWVPAEIVPLPPAVEAGATPVPARAEPEAPRRRRPSQPRAAEQNAATKPTAATKPKATATPKAVTKPPARSKRASDPKPQPASTRRQPKARTAG